MADTSLTGEQSAAFPILNEAQVDVLKTYGQTKRVDAGDVLFEEGDDSYTFIIILSGEIELTEQVGDERRVIVTHGAGKFLGELNLLIGQAVYLTATATQAGEVLELTLDALKRVIAQEAGLSELIFKAFLLRRSILSGLGAGLRIVGSRYNPDTRRLREFAARNRLPHTWLDLEEDEGADALLAAFEVKPDETPVVLWQGGTLLTNPSNAELASAIGLKRELGADEVFDLAVVGAGPAGLAASVYGASEGLSTVALEATAPGGQAGTSSRIENYLGFPAGLSGAELASRAQVQADKFGARFSVPSNVTGLRQEGGAYRLELAGGNSVTARSVVIATGARYRKLDVPGIEKYEGESVHYAATEAEARTCAGDAVVVVGGGNSAGQAALFLSESAAHVYLLIRGADLSASMSRYLSARIEENDAVTLLTHTEVRRLVGEERIEGVEVENNQTGETQTLDATALFVFIGAAACTDWLAGTLHLDKAGFITTGRDVKKVCAGNPTWQPVERDPYLLETSLPGVFAVGDVRSGSVKRVASAVGEGSMAVSFVHQVLAEEV